MGVVGNEFYTFLPPGKCSEQILWLFKGCFCIPNKFCQASFKLDSRGNWWNDNSTFFMLLLFQSDTQHVVPPFFFKTVSFAVFGVNTPKQEIKAVKTNENTSPYSEKVLLTKN
jgi:hypothetical protein